MINSEKLYNKAKLIIPGGVNSPVRAFNSVKCSPIYIEKGDGAYIYDADGNKYMDFCSSWGPLILGHANKKVVNAVKAAAESGLSFGACTRREIEMAVLLKECIPFLDMVRMVNSGTEAVMSAVRLARGYTGRNKIVKFDGCYHGHADYLLVSAGSGLLTNGISTSAGVPENAVADVIVVPYNDTETVKKVFQKYSSEIAAVIVEPVAGNMGLITPVKHFLETLRDLTDKSNSLLIFDEVITGFRFKTSTYASICNVTPDLITIGKIIGGGMPLAAFGGKKEIMEHLAPTGNVYQAGTLSGNPVALAAGISTIKTLLAEDSYSKCAEYSYDIQNAVNSAAEKNNWKLYCEAFMGIFTIFFGLISAPKNLNDVKECNTDIFAEFYKKMLSRGYYLSPSQFEINFISTAHSQENIHTFINDLIEVLNEVV